MSSLLGLFSGPLADRIGYRFMMRTGLGLLAVGMLLCGLVPSYGLASLLWGLHGWQRVMPEEKC